ncbi:hypothetical protein F4604DRAFT_1674960 [Suillus subluteus]|nr:hypothetical protein F4604DRAFT_1674960 [Suillus subluteus]
MLLPWAATCIDGHAIYQTQKTRFQRFWSSKKVDYNFSTANLHNIVRIMMLRIQGATDLPKLKKKIGELVRDAPQPDLRTGWLCADVCRENDEEGHGEGREMFALDNGEGDALSTKIADSLKRGLVSWNDFTVFETLLKRLNTADYWIAFQYFDVLGVVTCQGQFSVETCVSAAFLRARLLALKCPASPIIQEHPSMSIHLIDNEFTQLIKALHVFDRHLNINKDQDGFIRPEEFKQIILEVSRHKLSDAVIEHLPTLCTLTPNGWISYSEVIVVGILRETTAKLKDGHIDQSDYALFTPMEVSIIFHFAGRGSGEKRLALLDFAQLLDPQWKAPHEVLKAIEWHVIYCTTLSQRNSNIVISIGIAGLSVPLLSTLSFDMVYAKPYWWTDSNWVMGQLQEKMQVYALLGIQLLYKDARGRMEGAMVVPEAMSAQEWYISCRLTYSPWKAQMSMHTGTMLNRLSLVQGWQALPEAQTPQSVAQTLLTSPVLHQAHCEDKIWLGCSGSKKESGEGTPSQGKKTMFQELSGELRELQLGKLQLGDATK